MMRTFSFTSLLRTCLAIAAPVVVGFGLASTAPASAAATPAGTTISNTATATYQDPGGTTYNSQSNTVQTTVQNAPSMTIAPTSGAPGTNTVSPGGTITDTYTLTNTSNSSGYFQLTGVQGTDDGVTAGLGTFTTYVVNAGAGNQSFATVAAVNNYLSTGNAGSGVHDGGQRHDHDRRDVLGQRRRERHDHDQADAHGHAAGRSDGTGRHRRPRPRRRSSASTTTRSPSTRASTCRRPPRSAAPSRFPR